MLNRDDILLTQERIWGRYKVFGKLLKYNQLVQNGNFESTTNWEPMYGEVVFQNNKCVYTLTSANGSARIQQNISLKQGHKYIILMDFKGIKDKHYIRVAGNQGTILHSNMRVATNEKTTYSAVFIATGNDTLIYFYSNNQGHCEIGDVCEYSNVILIDLTDLQLDTITTLEQFYATDLGKEIQKGWYPPYSPTNAIYEADLSEMSLSGKNLLSSQLTTTDNILVDFGKDIHFDNACFSINVNNITFSSTSSAVVSIIKNDGTVVKNVTLYDLGNKPSGFTGVLKYVVSNNSFRKIIWRNYPNLTGIINMQLEEGNTATQYAPYVKPQKVSILQNGQPLKIGGIGTAKDYYLNASGKVNRKIGNVDLGSLSYSLASDGRFSSNSKLTDCKLPIDNNTPINAVCENYKIVSQSTAWGGNTQIGVGTNGYFRIRNDNYTDTTAFKNSLSGEILHYELATPTTEQANSVMLRKGYTKCYDKNNLELEIEVIDPLNFSNKIVQGKNTPTITAEKVITKGFTSGGEHFTQLYIYEDGEIWYVNSQGSAQAYASGVWELEYKQLQFDNKVSLTESERNALLNIYDLL